MKTNIFDHENQKVFKIKNLLIYLLKVFFFFDKWPKNNYSTFNWIWNQIG